MFVININQLEYFCVLAEEEHYTKAAKILSITQPSLSHSIKELEKELDVCLFTKQGRNIKINQYGQYLYDNVKVILADLERVKYDLQVMVDPRKGTVILSFLHSLAQEFIPTVISHFKQIEENSQIKFVLDQGTTEDIKEDFRSNKIDIAFTSKIEEDGIHSVPILKQELFLITPLDHPLALYDEIDLLEAANYPFIFYNEHSGMRPIIDSIFEQIGVKPVISYELADDTTICGFVSANLGIAIIPDIFGLDRYALKVIKIKKPLYERFIYLSYCTDKYMAPPVENFKKFILDHFIEKELETV